MRHSEAFVLWANTLGYDLSDKEEAATAEIHYQELMLDLFERIRRS
jgi:hypothetical protein